MAQLMALFLLATGPGPGASGVDYLPVSGVVARYGGTVWWAENRLIVILPGADSNLNEYLFLPDSNLVVHNGKSLKLPLPGRVEKNQFYLPAVVLAGLFPELDVPVLSAVETDKTGDTTILRLLLNPLGKKAAAPLFFRERGSSLELRLVLGCRPDSALPAQLRLLALTGGNVFNGIMLDTLAVGVNLICTFRMPMNDTILVRGNSIEVRVWPKPRRRVRTVVLDPGHGGTDPGAVGFRGTEEKRVVLDICRRVKKHLTQAGFQVVLTRDTDEYLPLSRRAEIAAQCGADLFVSVHANAAPNRSAAGVETYFLSEAKTDWERAVAASENAVFEREIANPGAKEKNPVRLILADLAQNEFLFESSELAASIQRCAVQQGCAVDRGVRQANFYVLRNIFMPAVLVECGFLSNRQEEKLLRDPDHRERLARAIASGISDFSRDYEKRLNGVKR